MLYYYHLLSPDEIMDKVTEVKINEANYGCTMVILNYNRPDSLRRIQYYYNEYGWDDFVDK